MGFTMDQGDVPDELDQLEGIAKHLLHLITPSEALYVNEVQTMFITLSLSDTYFQLSGSIQWLMCVILIYLSLIYLCA